MMSDAPDIVVIGAGAAGLTAARVAAEGGARVLVLERLGPGGQVATIDRITNFPGEAEIGGYELGPMLQDEAEAAGARFDLAEVTGLARDGAGWRIETAAGPMGARAVILACGSTRRALGVPGEADYTGRGVSHCASCDGGFFRGQTVVVAGGGDSALDEALVLSEVVGQVVLVHRGPALTATLGQPLVLAQRPNVTVLRQTEVTGVEGDASGMTGVTLRHASGESGLQQASGLFVYVGLQPNSGFLQGTVGLDGEGRVIVSDRLEASVPGLYAAGDLRRGFRGMLSDAVSDGARAARSALDALRQRQTAGPEDPSGVPAAAPGTDPADQRGGEQR